MTKGFFNRIKSECNNLDKTGFWFPRFRYSICFLHKLISPRQWQWVNNLLDKVAKDEPSKSEIYQSIWIGTGIIWIFFLNYLEVTGYILMYIGACIALLRPLDIFLFTLHWLFIKGTSKTDNSKRYDVESFRRSFAMFMVNMIEISLFLSITYILLHPNLNAWDTIVESFKAVFGLKHLTEINKIILNPYVSLFQIITSWFLYGVILVNVLGSIKRIENADENQVKSKSKS